MTNANVEEFNSYNTRRLADKELIKLLASIAINNEGSNFRN